MARQSYRERYFEEYKAKTVSVGGKTRVRYDYVGPWYRWGGEDGFELKKRKALYAALELFGLTAYLFSALQPCALNTQKLAAGFGILSVVPWLLALWSVLRFLLGKEYITVLDFSEIDSRIRLGSLFHALLLALSLLCGAIGAARLGAFDKNSILALCAGLLACASSLAVNRLQKRIGYRTYHNNDGKVGTEC